MERALAADLLPLERRGTGYGALATVNSFGDLTSSIVVGFLWTKESYAAGFWYGGILTVIGAIALATSRTTPPDETLRRVRPGPAPAGGLANIDNVRGI
jgi:MFS family permease